jgi:hypothetical protein
MKAISSGQFRVYKARWREAFKKQWKKETCKVVDPEKLKEYHTNPVNWVCACKSFVYSRFLPCKHIVHCFESPSREFSETIRRQTTYPFWKDERLILRPEYEPRVQLDTQDLQEDNAKESVFDSSSESELDEDEDSEQEAAPMEIQMAKFKKRMQDAMVIFDEQAAKGNEKIVEKFIASNQLTCALVDEVENLRNKRSMPSTWGRYRHPATKYFK